MKSGVISFYFLCLFSTAFLTSCVGTVTDSLTPKSAITEAPEPSIKFGGVTTATAISNDKIEVFFEPASEGSGRYTYLVFAGDTLYPITIPSEVLVPDYRGLLRYTVTGLETGKLYSIKMEASDQVSGAKDDNIIIKTVRTFQVPVADFSGIGSVANTSGVDGLDAIKVRWPHAYIDFGSVSPGNGPTDPISYEVIGIDSTLLSPTNMDDATKGPAQGRFAKIIPYNIQVIETEMRGLKPDTKYYFRVRAIHKNTQIDPNDPGLRSEKNTNILAAKTLSADLASINFKVNGLSVARNVGGAQSSSLILTWPAITGVFEHIRIYYAQSQSDLANMSVATCKIETTKGCKKLPTNSVGTIVASLMANRDYYFKVVVCQFQDCVSNMMGISKSGDTKPLLAGFSGINSIDVALKVSDLGKVFVNFSLPDFTSGNFDGYHISYRKNDSDNPVVINIAGYSGPLRVEEFDYLNATKLVISGVDYGSGDDYRFSMYPFVWDDTAALGYVSFPNGIEKMIKAVIAGPDIIQFPGFTDADVKLNTITMNWNMPLGGVFDYYEIFVRQKQNGGGFSFSQALACVEDPSIAECSTAGVPHYYRLTASALENTYSLMVPNGTYTIGIRTAYLFLPLTGAGSIYRSAANTTIQQCVVDGVNNKDCINL
jgi:hypothetical protein